MCLYAISGIRTAKVDITVYKVLTEKNRSIFCLFPYEPNTTYRLEQELVIKNNAKVHEGFHAFQTLERARRLLVRKEKEKIVGFTIHKGAKYVLGNNGDIVSTSIHSGSLEAIRS